MQHTYCYRIKELCIKLVIDISLYIVHGQKNIKLRYKCLWYFSFCFIYTHILRLKPSDSATVPCIEDVWNQQNRPLGLKKVSNQLAGRFSDFTFAEAFSAKRSVRGQTAVSIRTHSLLLSPVTGRHQGNLPYTETSDGPIRLHRVQSLENIKCIGILKQIVGKTSAQNTEGTSVVFHVLQAEVRLWWDRLRWCGGGRKVPYSSLGRDGGHPV